MNRKPYPSDLTDDQWQLVQPFLAAAKPGGRPRKTDLREVVNAIFYLNREGCTPAGPAGRLPALADRVRILRGLERDGTWDEINGALRRQLRVAAGRPHTPTTASIDSQTAWKPWKSPTAAGYDGGKKLSGRKRHIVVDVLGLLLAVLVSRRPPWPTPSPPGRCWSR